MEVMSRHGCSFSYFRVDLHASARLPSTLTQQLPGLDPCAFKLHPGASTLIPSFLSSGKCRRRQIAICAFYFSPSIHRLTYSDFSWVTVCIPGNVSAHPAESTGCPNCGKMLIKRLNYEIVQYHLDGSRCQYYGQEITGYFE
jgi:hypothetical protein